MTDSRTPGVIEQRQMQLLRSIDSCIRCADVHNESLRHTASTTIRTICQPHWDALSLYIKSEGT